MGLRSASATIQGRWLGRLCIGATVLAFALPACTGVIGEPPDEALVPPKTAEQLGHAPRSRFPRLSHAQWENTVRDLLYLDATPGFSASFTGDPLGGYFDNNEAVLQVTPGLWADYQSAAEELSAMVTSDPEKLGKVFPPDTSMELEARARAFIESFGLRAYRRPLAAAEIDQYAALFSQAKDILTDIDPLIAGTRLVLQAFLQSPHFVYRVEVSDKARADGLIALNSYEVATKLSYLLWNTTPDSDLLAAAKAGELTTAAGARAYAEKMLADPRARETIAAFHRQLYAYDKYLDLYKDPAAFPDFTPEVGEDMLREVELFTDDIVFERSGGLVDILTSRTSFVNDRLAKIYGLEGEFTGEFKKVELDAKERSGFLTRAGFLAANATARQPDSIHRGVFINLRVLCAALPPPPNNVPPLPAVTGKTNREIVTSHTGKGTCGEACHGALINPIGFAFEHYDAVGGFRTEDNGFPINSADSYMFGGEAKTYEDAVALSQVIAESKDAHRCYAKHWLEFAYGRASVKADGPTLTKLGEESLAGGSTKDILLKLIESDAFLTRAPAAPEAP